jgi:hypothetical protein
MNRYRHQGVHHARVHLEMEPRKHGRVDHQDPNNQEDTSKDGGQNIPQAKPAKSD